MKASLKISAVAHRQAEETFLRDGISRLTSLFPDIHFIADNTIPDLLFFLSGGSEQDAIRRLEPGRFTLLLAGSEGNALASALEVKAWAIHRNIQVEILSLDEARHDNKLLHYAQVFSGLRNLAGKCAGLIGDVSHWLVASALTPAIAKERLGIDILHLPWKAIPRYHDYPPHPEFLEVFASHQKKNSQSTIREPGKKLSPDHSNITANDTQETDPWQKEAGVYAFLLELIRDHHLDALTLECFDMVNDHHVTACLSLALLNSKGLPAGCEGDTVSLAGMMLAKAVTGQIPWMANVAAMNEDSVLFAHCTAPLDLLEDFTIDTHFETDKSAAIAGHVQPSEVTIFRLDEKLEKAFVTPGTILSRPGLLYACRTQTMISMNPEAILLMKEKPLGNHHLILPGNQAELLQKVCRVKNIDILR